MEFFIEDKVFESLPNVCIGVVVAKGINNRGKNEKIVKLLEESIEFARKKFEGANIKEHPDILCYREALRKVNINPNKFPCSIEAMTSRVVKGNKLPSINNVVDLINAVSLKYTLPMGTHDLKYVEGNLKICFSKGGEPFIPFGQSEPEYLSEGELVYAVDRRLKHAAGYDPVRNREDNGGNQRCFCADRWVWGL